MCVCVATRPHFHSSLLRLDEGEAREHSYVGFCFSGITLQGCLVCSVNGVNRLCPLFSFSTIFLGGDPGSSAYMEARVAGVAELLLVGKKF